MNDPAILAKRIGRHFANYRRNIEQARDPDEPARARAAAWSRAANQRSRIEKTIAKLTGEAP